MRSRRPDSRGSCRCTAARSRARSDPRAPPSSGRSARAASPSPRPSSRRWGTSAGRSRSARTPRSRRPCSRPAGPARRPGSRVAWTGLEESGVRVQRGCDAGCERPASAHADKRTTRRPVEHHPRQPEGPQDLIEVVEPAVRRPGDPGDVGAKAVVRARPDDRQGRVEGGHAARREPDTHEPLVAVGPRQLGGVCPQREFLLAVELLRWDVDRRSEAGRARRQGVGDRPRGERAAVRRAPSRARRAQPGPRASDAIAGSAATAEPSSKMTVVVAGGRGNTFSES